MTERVRLTDKASPSGRVRERLGEDGGAQPAKRQKAKRRSLRMTEANVAALRIDKAGSYLAWDHGTDAQRGLAVMVLPSGAETYYAYYNFPKQPSNRWRSVASVRCRSIRPGSARARRAARPRRASTPLQTIQGAA